MVLRVNNMSNVPSVGKWEGLLPTGSSSSTIVDCTAKKDGFSCKATPAEGLAKIEKKASGQAEFRPQSLFRKV